MKPTYIFRFVTDAPHIRSIESRDRVARALRAYRANRRQFVVTRLPLGFMVHTRDYSAVACYTRE